MSPLYNISMAERNQTLTFEIWGEGFQFLRSSRWEVGKKSLRTKQDQRAKRQLKTSKNRHISKKNKVFFQFSNQLVFPKNKSASPFLRLSEKPSFSNQPVIKSSSKLRRVFVFREACGSAWLTFSCNLLKLQSSIQKPFSSRRPKKQKMIPEVVWRW